MTLQIITLDAGLIVHEVDVVMCSFVELIVSSMRKNITEISTHSGSPSHWKQKSNPRDSWQHLAAKEVDLDTLLAIYEINILKFYAL